MSLPLQPSSRRQRRSASSSSSTARGHNAAGSLASCRARLRLLPARRPQPAPSPGSCCGGGDAGRGCRSRGPRQPARRRYIINMLLSCAADHRRGAVRTVEEQSLPDLSVVRLLYCSLCRCCAVRLYVRGYVRPAAGAAMAIRDGMLCCRLPAGPSGVRVSERPRSGPL
jgi:hypothetical protein